MSVTERIPQSPPKISILPDSIGERPRWSVMIPVYNCKDLMVEALESVLAQDMGEEMMQIEVVDDASTDADVEAVVGKIGRGRVKYFRQPKNVGSLLNFKTCIDRARGHLIHLMHGDDRVKFGFYEKMDRLFKDFPEAGAAFCNYQSIDHFGNAKSQAKGWFGQSKDGYLDDPLYVLGVQHPSQYVSTVVKRCVYEDLGSFYGVVYGEDWEMWTRIATKYRYAFTPEVLAEYRSTNGSITLPKIETGKNAFDLCSTVKRVEAMLPKRLQKEMGWNRRWCARVSLARARKMIKQGNSLKDVTPLTMLAIKTRPLDLLIYWKICSNALLFFVRGIGSGMGAK